MDKFRVALAQITPKLFDKQGNLALAEQLMSQAAAQKANVIIFPELFLTGYSLGERAVEMAETIEGASARCIANLADRFNIAVVMGFAERSSDGKGAYDAAFVSNVRGQILGSYRKTHLFQKEKSWFLPGDSACLVDLGFGSTGLLICYDLEFPEAARDLALRGAQWIAVCTGNMTPNQHLQEIIVQSRAAENRLWIALANRLGKEAELTFFGWSAVADPFGNLSIQGGSTETLLIADIDLSLAAKARLNADYLTDRRPQLYQTLVHQGQSDE